MDKVKEMEKELVSFKQRSNVAINLIKKASEKITTATRETRKKVTDARFAAMRIFYDKHYKKRYPAILRNLVLLGISVKKFFAERSL